MLALCASINQTGSKYCAKVQLQEGDNDEIAKNLSVIIEEVLETFKKINSIYPENIVIYRDGVGDSQKTVVMNLEIDQINRALKNKGLENTKFAFIMVNKRVKTKIISDNNGRLENPRSGTVLDYAITP
jgi:hypothetical protein